MIKEDLPRRDVATTRLSGNEKNLKQRTVRPHRTEIFLNTGSRGRYYLNKQWNNGNLERGSEKEKASGSDVVVTSYSHNNPSHPHQAAVQRYSLEDPLKIHFKTRPAPEVSPPLPRPIFYPSPYLTHPIQTQSKTSNSQSSGIGIQPMSTSTRTNTLTSPHNRFDGFPAAVHP